MNKQLTAQLIFIFLFTLFVGNCLGQNCSCISEIKNNKDSTETNSGLTFSIDHCALLILKVTNYKDTSVAPKYHFILSTPSKHLLSDSVLKSKGTSELLLLDSSKVTFEGVTSFNNAPAFGISYGFQVILTEEQLKIIASNPIVSISAFGILKTSFAPKKQKEQQKIINCLLDGKGN